MDFNDGSTTQKHRNFCFVVAVERAAEIDLACLDTILAVCNTHKVSPIKPQSLREEGIHHSNSFYACQNRMSFALASTSYCLLP